MLPTIMVSATTFQSVATNFISVFPALPIPTKLQTCLEYLLHISWVTQMHLKLKMSKIHALLCSESELLFLSSLLGEMAPLSNLGIFFPSSASLTAQVLKTSSPKSNSSQSSSFHSVYCPSSRSSHSLPRCYCLLTSFPDSSLTPNSILP